MNSRFITMLLALACSSTVQLWAQQAPPVGSVNNPKHTEITSSDLGPDIDPVKLTASPYNGAPFITFRSFMSGSYAFADVWVYAENDDQGLYDTPLEFTYPQFYKPSWGEVFDHIARQLKCTWEWNPKNRQFKFFKSTSGPFFGVDLAKGWRQEDRGFYVWHAPEGRDFGMDIYYFGQFNPLRREQGAARGERTGLYERVRAHFALKMLSGFPNPPTEKQMSTVNISGVPALYAKTDTPRPGAIWRQWSFVLDGHAFVIVSVMPKELESKLVPDIEQMVKSFKLKHYTVRNK